MRPGWRVGLQTCTVDLNPDDRSSRSGLLHTLLDFDPEQFGIEDLRVEVCQLMTNAQQHAYSIAAAKRRNAVDADKVPQPAGIGSSQRSHQPRFARAGLTDDQNITAVRAGEAFPNFIAQPVARYDARAVQISGEEWLIEQVPLLEGPAGS